MEAEARSRGQEPKQRAEGGSWWGMPRRLGAPKVPARRSTNSFSRTRRSAKGEGLVDAQLGEWRGRGSLSRRGRLDARRSRRWLETRRELGASEPALRPEGCPREEGGEAAGARGRRALRPYCQLGGGGARGRRGGGHEVRRRPREWKVANARRLVRGVGR